MKNLLVLVALLVTIAGFAQLPKGFVYVNDIVPSIKVELRYYGEQNFLGTKVDSYNKEVAILTSQAALALKKVQTELMGYDLSIKIFDSYRPQSAVDHFVQAESR